ncbi:MAG TPA: SAM-dependent methyltransferase [Anaeromyxobacter sp.]|nr:SAM-dependent methyltransferase [Anaeromyxobacter sp.]
MRSTTCRVTLLTLAACATGGPARPPDYAPVLAAPDRLEADRAIDGGRHPAETLAFAGVRPGMRVADLAAGGGYTTEILARAVAPGGVVFSQNNALLTKLAGDAWTARLARPALADVVRVEREFEDPLPPEATHLDLVVIYASYHDLVAMKVDRGRMDRAVFTALKPGGAFVVVDHSARPGSGVEDSPTLHRIDEELVKSEVQAAGFRLAAEGSFLRNPDDARDWSTSPRAAGERRGTSDRFALRFLRP